VNRRNKLQTVGNAAVCLVAICLFGCGANSGSTNETDTSETGIDQVEAGLAEGASSPAVAAVQKYLGQYGYFQNAELARRYPAWRPVVSAAPQLGKFDAATAEAVMAFQHNLGLPMTAVVDGNTLAAMQMPRCGSPDGMEKIDSHSKWDIAGTNPNDITWRETGAGVPNVSLVQLQSAAQSAANTWTAEMSKPIPRLATGTPQIFVKFENITTNGVCDNNTLGDAGFINGTYTIRLNSCLAWTPQQAQTVLIHEFGHGMGLNHSGFETAIMYPSGNGTQSLNIDDRVAASVQYDTWEQLPGLATDISVGANGAVWIVGALIAGQDYGSIFKWNGSNWTQEVSSGLGKRIAVSPTGIPWVIGADNKVYKRTSASPTTAASWVSVGQASTCAQDLAVSADGSAWVIGCGSPNGGIFKLVSGTWVEASGGGLATRIALGATGIPWLVNSGAQLFRRSSSSHSSGAWGGLPGLGNDISVTPLQANDNNYAWLIGSNALPEGFSIFAWNEQPSVNFGNPNPAVKSDWYGVTGAATQVAAAPDGKPWIVQNNGHIFRTVK
jgi:hypothetical protein